MYQSILATSPPSSRALARRHPGDELRVAQAVDRLETGSVQAHDQRGVAGEHAFVRHAGQRNFGVEQDRRCGVTQVADQVGLGVGELLGGDEFGPSGARS